MNLFDILKQFKNIEPDPVFKENSKRAILASESMASATHRSRAQRTIWKVIEIGAAVALIGFFVLLITGTFSTSKFAPVQYSAIDPQSLRAEAQAIDIQIQLANLNYSEPSAESTMQVAGVKPKGAKVAPSFTPSSTAESGAIATSSASSMVSIDQALKSLTQ